MQIIRKFHYKCKEVSHDEIVTKLLKLWNLEVQFLGSHTENHWNCGKIEHENGLKLKKSNMKMGQNCNPL